jgi:hypothetical protein
MSGLCEECSQKFYTCDVGHCGSCGGMTSSGMISLCDKCAIEKNTCGACGRKPLKQQESTATSNTNTTTTEQPKQPQ